MLGKFIQFVSENYKSITIKNGYDIIANGIGDSQYSFF